MTYYEWAKAYFDLGRKRRMWRVSKWLLTHSRMHGTWAPAKATIAYETPLNSLDPNHYDNVIINNGKREMQDAEYTDIWDRRKPWKRMNSGSKDLFWRNIGWL